MEIKYVNINFKNGFADRVPTVTQYDYGQHLRITGLSLPEAVEFHFKNQKSEETLLVAGFTSDGITTVQIPNSMLKEPHNITAYVYVSDGESGKTVYRIDLNMRVRNAPQEISTDPNDEHYVNGVSELIAAAAAAANLAKDSLEEAKNAKEVCLSAAAATQALCDTLTPADAHYDKESWTAQSGVAVAEATENAKSEMKDWVQDYTEQNFASVLVANKSGTIIEMPDVSPVPHTFNVKIKGRNILPLPYFFGNSVTVKGVTVTADENGTVTLNGVCTEDYEMGDVALENMTPVDFEKTYLCSVETTGDFGTLHFFCEHEDGYYGFSSYMLDSTKLNDTFNGIKSVQLHLYLTAGTAYNNVKFTPSLVVQNGNSQRVIQCGKNLFPFNKSATISGYYINGTKNDFLPAQTNIQFLRGEKITYSAFFDLSGALEDTTTASLKIIYYDANDAIISQVFGSTLKKSDGILSGYAEVTTVVPQNAEKIMFCVCVFFNGTQTPTGNSFVTVSEGMVELGNMRTEHEEYKGKTFTANSDNGVNVPYTSEFITLIPETDGYMLCCQYKRDINKVIAKIEFAIKALGGEI